MAEERGAILPVVAVVVGALVLLVLVGGGDLLRWQAISEIEQSAVDAAALAGAAEVWVHREVDASGAVLSQVVYLNETEAKAQAQHILDENLLRLRGGDAITDVTSAIRVDTQQMYVEVQVSGTPKAMLADRYGFLTPQLTRLARATPVMQQGG